MRFVALNFMPLMFETICSKKVEIIKIGYENIGSTRVWYNVPMKFSRNKVEMGDLTDHHNSNGPLE